MTEPVVKEEVVKAEKKVLIERKIMPDIFMRNLEALKLKGWEENGYIEKIKAATEKKIKIDPNIIIGGIKNPLISIFMGFSTRRLYDAMTRKKKIIRYCIIIEPDFGVFKHLIGVEDLTDLILNPDIDIILGESGEELRPTLFKKFILPTSDKTCGRSTMLESRELIADPFQEYKPEQIQAFAENINTINKQITLSMGCSDDQFTRWFLLMKNIKPMLNSWSMKDLFGKFRDVPAIVLGGGKSLDDFIETYKANPKMANAIIIAADAVLHKLITAGIRPHIVTRCERKLTNIFKGVTKDLTKGIHYAAYPWTPTEYFDLFDDTFYLFRQNGVCLFTGLGHASVDGGVSSGNAAMEIAIDLGCKHIFLAGIDLWAIDGNTHCEGTQVEFNVEKSMEKSSVEIETNDGKKVKTPAVWERCRNEYAQSIDKHKQKGEKFEVINTSKRGGRIPFTKPAAFEDYKGVFEEDKNPAELIARYRKHLSEKEKPLFVEKVKASAPKFKEWSNDVDIAIGLAEDAKNTTNNEISKILLKCKDMSNTPFENVLAIRGNTANYQKLWTSVSDAYDQNFKRKLYPEPLYQTTMVDVLQINIYHYENNCAKLINGVEQLDERVFHYCRFTKEFLVDVKYYLDKFAELFKNAVTSLEDVVPNEPKTCS